MKRLTRIIMLLLVLSLLAACTDQPRKEPQIEAVYDSVMYRLDLPESSSYELAGNGRNAVMLPFSNNGDNGDANVLISMPEHLSPVAATRIERAAVVEYVAFILHIFSDKGPHVSCACKYIRRSSP